MCLITSKFYHKKDKNHRVKCLVAQEDILVYKCIDNLEDDEDGEYYCTPFQYMPIIFTKGKYVYNEVDMDENAYCGKDVKDVCACIDVGIHAFGKKGTAIGICKNYHRDSGTSMHYAVIPKGSNFYIGIDDDVVSNNLIVYRQKRCFDKHYPNIIDITEYIGKYLK